MRSRVRALSRHGSWFLHRILSLLSYSYLQKFQFDVSWAIAFNGYRRCSELKRLAWKRLVRGSKRLVMVLALSLGPFAIFLGLLVTLLVQLMSPPVATPTTIMLTGSNCSTSSLQRALASFRSDPKSEHTRSVIHASYTLKLNCSNSTFHISNPVVVSSNTNIVVGSGQGLVRLVGEGHHHRLFTVEHGAHLSVNGGGRLVVEGFQLIAGAAPGDPGGTIPGQLAGSGKSVSSFSKSGAGTKPSGSFTAGSKSSVHIFALSACTSGSNCSNQTNQGSTSGGSSGIGGTSAGPSAGGSGGGGGGGACSNGGSGYQGDWGSNYADGTNGADVTNTSGGSGGSPNGGAGSGGDASSCGSTAAGGSVWGGGGGGGGGEGYGGSWGSWKGGGGGGGGGVGAYGGYGAPAPPSNGEQGGGGGGPGGGGSNGSSSGAGGNGGGGG